MAHVLAKKLELLQCSCHPHLKFPIFAVTPVFRVLYTGGIHFCSYPRLLCLVYHRYTFSQLPRPTRPVYQWYTFLQLPPSYTECIPRGIHFAVTPVLHMMYTARYIILLLGYDIQNPSLSLELILIVYFCLDSIYTFLQQAPVIVGL